MAGQGAVGEAAVGQQFKRAASDLSGAGGSLNPKQRTKRSGSDVDENESAGGGGGAAIGGHGQSSAPMPMLRSILAKSTTSVTFKNKFMIKSMAYSWACKEKTSTALKGSGTLRSTSLLWLPLMHAKFYLSSSEYDKLPAPSRVTHVSCQVIPIGNQTSFDYGSTLTGSATSEHVVLYARAYGLNDVIPAWPVKVTADPSKPCLTTGFAKFEKNADYTEIMEKRWGKADGEDKKFCNVDLAITHMNSYLAYASPYTATTGRWRLDRLVDVYPHNAGLGEPIISWDYSPKMGYLKIDKASEYLTQDKETIMISTREEGTQRYKAVKSDGSVQGYKGEFALSDNVNSTVLLYDSVAIEQGDWLRMGMDMGGHVFKPTLNLPFFGVLPIQADGATDASPEWVRCSTIWQIQTSMTVEIDLRNLNYTSAAYHDIHHSRMVHLGTKKKGAGCSAHRFYTPNYYGGGIDPAGGSAMEAEPASSSLDSTLTLGKVRTIPLLIYCLLD